MSDVVPPLGDLLRDLVLPEDRWLFVRRVLGPSDEMRVRRPLSDDWTTRLADVPVEQVLEALRTAHARALPRIDAVGSKLVPADARLQRIVPAAPVYLCLVGRSEVVQGLLEHPVLKEGGHLHLVGGPQSGRSLVAAQVVRRAADTVPVVVWLDGRSPEGLRAGLLRLAAELGIPSGPHAHTLSLLGDWFAGQGDWMVVLDDAPAELPRALRGLRHGRILTVGVERRADANASVVLPELTPAQRAELAHRWSRRKLSEVDPTLSVGALSVVAAAAARGWAGTGGAVAAAEALSADAQALRSLVQAYALAPIPLSLVTWPEGVTPDPSAPRDLHPLMRSGRVMRSAATELVRAARAEWVGDDLRPQSDSSDAAPEPEVMTVAAVYVLHALHRVSELPVSWMPHVASLSSAPRVSADLRRALARRAGRLVLSGGDPVQAVVWFERALAGIEVDSPRSKAAVLNDLGVAWRRCGRLEEAAAAFLDALAQELDDSGEDALAVATSQTNLAHVRREQGEAERAQSLYRQAHETRSRMLGVAHRETVAVSIQLGVVARRLGFIDEARAAWTQAVRTLSRARPPEPRLLSDVLVHQARLEGAEGQIDLAVRAAERAHGLLVAHHDDIDHPDVVEVRMLVRALDAGSGRLAAVEGQAQRPEPRTR